MNYYLDAVQAWKSSRRKPRTDWKLGRLSDERLADLLKHFDSGVGYAELRQICEKDFKVALTTDRQLSEFLLSARHFILPARTQAAAIDAKSVTEAIPNLDAKNKYLVQQTIFEILASPGPKAEQLSTAIAAAIRLQEHSLKERDLSIKLRRLEALEKIAAKAKLAESNSKLSDAEKAKRIREIFKRAE